MIRENNNLLKCFLENALDAIVIWDKDGNIIKNNSIAAEIFGFGQEEIKGNNIASLVPHLATYQGDNWQGESLHCELSGNNQQGKVFPLELKIRGIELKGKALVLGNFKDISDKKFSAKEVVVREKRFSQLFDITEEKKQYDDLTKAVNDLREVSNLLPALIWRAGPDGKCQYVNKTWTDFTGRTFEEEIGDGWRDRTHPEDKFFVPSFPEKQGPLEFECRFLRHDGEYRWLKVMANPSFSSSGKFTGYVGCCFDKTDLKESKKGNFLIHNVAMQVLEEKPTSEILQFLCDNLVGIFDLSLAWIGITEKDGNLTTQTYGGTAIEYINRVQRLSWDDVPCPAVLALKTGKFHTFEVQESGQHPWWAEAYREGIRSIAAYPLVIKGKVMGVISLFSGKQNYFTVNRLTQLESIAGQIAIVLNAAFIRQRLSIFSKALEAADNGVMILDRESKIQWVNQASLRLSGYNREEVMGRHPSFLSSGLYDPAFIRDIEDTVHSGKVWKGEITNKRKDGNLYLIEATITPVYEELGSIVNLIDIQQDITERKKEEEKLQQYKILFKSARDMIFLTRLDGSFAEVNEAGAEGHGYTMEEIMSKKAQDLRVSNTYPTVEEQMNKVDEKGAIYETIHKKKEGSIFPVEVSLQAVNIGQDRYVVSILRDLTKRKRVEADRLKALQQVEKAERLASLGTMVAGIAHEINQPLNALRILADGTLYLSKRGKISDCNKVIENLARVSEQVNRIDEIIRQMRMLIGRERTQELKPCCLNEAVRGALSILGNQIKAHGITVKTRLAETLPKCMGQSGQFEEVVINLLTNSIQALDMTIQEVKEIGCTTLVEGENVVLIITDNGIGIPRELQDKVFEPFFSNKPVGVGMGLGLTIVHAIVSSYQGHVSVRNHEPQGTIVVIKCHAANKKRRTICRYLDDVSDIL